MMRYLPASAPVPRSRPDLEFIPEEGDPRRYSFEELSHAVEAYASYLHGRGIGAGDRVGLYLDNSPELIVAVFGNHLLGAVSVPVNPAHPVEELAYVAGRSRISALLTDREVDLAGTWRGGVSDRVPGGGGWDPDDDVLRLDAASLMDELRRVDVGGFPENRDPGAAALLVFTSGTTGTPKGVPLTHRNLRASLRDLESVWEWTADDHLLLSLPLFHVHGLGLGIHGWALTGCSLQVLHGFQAERVLDLLTTGPATMYFGVPTIYRRLVDAYRAGRHDATGLRLAVTGSDGMPVELHERCREVFGQTLVERYGMTETMMNTSNRLDRRRPGTVGFPLPSVDLRIVRVSDAGEGERGEADEVDGAGEPGEILVRGPNVFSGYHEEPEATEKAFVDGPGGWFRTGDLGRWDEDGFLHHMGRISVDFLKSGGHRIGAREVEEVLERHPVVAEAAVVGVPDETWGERVTAFVVTADPLEPRDRAGIVEATGGEGDEGLAEELVEHCREHLASYKLPRTVHLVDRLPKNAMGKVTKRSLVERAVTVLEEG